MYWPDVHAASEITHRNMGTESDIILYFDGSGSGHYEHEDVCIPYTWDSDRGDILLLYFSHEANDRKDYKSAKYGRATVNTGHYQSVLVAIVVERIVAAQSDQRAETETVGEEHLRCRINPHLSMAITGEESKYRQNSGSKILVCIYTTWESWSLVILGVM